MMRPGKRHWLAIVPVAAILCGGGYWASLPESTGPAAGSELQGSVVSPLAHRPTLRIGTLNIHGGKDSDLSRIADCLADLDFVALQEVHGGGLCCGGDQAARLGEQLDAGWLFAPTQREWFVAESGNGLLSRLPVRSWQRIPLVRQCDRGYRNAVLVSLPFRSRTIQVLITHITRRNDTERREQLRAVTDMYLALAEPAILLGDLNTTADDPQLRDLLATSGVEDAVAKSSAEAAAGQDAPGRIDWIITRGLRCVAAGVREKGISDHPLVWAEIDLGPYADEPVLLRSRTPISTSPNPEIPSP